MRFPVSILSAAIAALLLPIAEGPARAQALADASPSPAASATPSATPAAAASPQATPFPDQDRPGTGVPAGFDDAIHAQGLPEATPTPDPDVMTPEEIAHPPIVEHSSDWNPENVFPGNYYALPLTVEFAMKPCLTCKGVSSQPFLESPGELSVWAGYAFQPMKASSSPFAAAGLDYTFYENGRDGSHGTRNMLAPTMRWGWTWTAANAYLQTGVILPGEDRDRAGLHVGVGGNSFALMLASVCLGEVIPSVYEFGYDWLPRDPLTGRTRNRWVLKVGWGF